MLGNILNILGNQPFYLIKILHGHVQQVVLNHESQYHLDNINYILGHFLVFHRELRLPF